MRNCIFCNFAEDRIVIMQEDAIQVGMDFWVGTANAKLDSRIGYLIDAAIVAVRYTSSNQSPHWFEWAKQ